MKTEETEWLDWKRILIGDAPGEFLIEVIIRAAVMLLVILVILRLMRRKNISRPFTETGIIIAIGAIVSLPLQMPERGLLPAIIILGFTVFLNHIHQLAISRSGRIEKLASGSVIMIIKDGIIDTGSLKETSITRDQLFSMLRNRKITSLGEIKRIYLEPGGFLSIIRSDVSRPGLSVLPAKDNDISMAVKTPEFLSCTTCGFTRDSQVKGNDCPSCGTNAWDNSVMTDNGRK